MLLDWTFSRVFGFWISVIAWTSCLHTFVQLSTSRLTNIHFMCMCIFLLVWFSSVCLTQGCLTNVRYNILWTFFLLACFLCYAKNLCSHSSVSKGFQSSSQKNENQITPFPYLKSKNSMIPKERGLERENWDISIFCFVSINSIQL